MRKQVSSQSPWEEKAGYSRAVRVDGRIEVAGTTALQGGAVHAPGDAHAQALFVLGLVEESLHSLGAAMEDVVRTRMYLVDMADAEAVARAHKAVFGNIRPAATMVQVAGLVHPDLRVEVEVEAALEQKAVTLY